MNKTQAAFNALPTDLVSKLCRTKATRLSLKQMYSLGRHVLESKNQGALVIPAVFLYQELPIRLSHALKLLNSTLLPVNMTDMPTFQQVARSYVEDISLVTQMPKPSTPKLEEEFTALLRNLEQRHKVKMLAISQGFRELVASVQGQCATKQDQVLSLSGFSSTQDGNNGRLIDPETDKAIQSFFNRFYTINLGTRLLIGEHLALHDRGLNLVQRVNPLSISKSAIRDAQRVCAAHYGQSAPSVLIQTPNPDISATYVDEFLHRNIYELLKNSMRATCDAHLRDGSPVTIGLSTEKERGTAARSAMPPVTLTLVDGGEDVTIKIMDQGGGLALSDMENIWSYVNPVKSRPSPPSQNIASPTMSATAADSLAAMGGVASEAKDYLDSPLHGSGHGLPLARLIARYFGGDLSLISMEGYGTDSYLSLYRNDDHPENFPEVDEEMQAEVDVFVNELMDECNVDALSSLQLKKGPLAASAAVSASPDILPPVHPIPAGMALGLRQTSTAATAKLPSSPIGIPPTSPTTETPSL
ncbi:branched-chain alpha-ketoacid dehydrogenase kinase [Linnemannia elongata]|nr:branched-chain alpha-ketoacid dehydrogenase kinase [Linnemannia elongata]